ncbi:HNH endonuclease [Clostridium gasigenes]|uniref:HNH endonuclease n=1 Tax=Clostridium gasigenes TaxID=94869 RepID=UPI001C0BF661|nr:HNH endonuclease [Clostridium gasigenes]MBU3135054.1 HNH endonuclease [Clostridium gasigenes]
MLMKLCPRCGVEIEYGAKRCDDCTIKVDAERKYDASNKTDEQVDKDREQWRQYKTKRKDDELDYRSQQFYISKAWSLTRKRVLGDYEYECIWSKYVDDETLESNTVHHIEEIKESWELRFDKDNLFPCNKKKHSIIHYLYLKDKIGTQRLLIELLDRWKKENEE